MKNSYRVLCLVIVISILGFSGSSKMFINNSFANSNLNIIESEQPAGNKLIGAKAAKADASLTLEEMLTYAIQDEYLARAKYGLVVEKFGSQRPFSNIIRSEETHIASLKPLFARYNVQIPVDNAREYLSTPNSLKESFEAGVQGEIENIEMYDRFLKQDIPNDVRTVFTRLRNASRNHLRAFQKGLAR